MIVTRRRWAWSALAGVLGLALALRLWGIAQGLPYVYNLDEADHFVPRAVAMFRGSLNPHYFANPPALTYLLHALFAVWFGGARGVAHAYAHDPEQVYVLARASTAVLGVVAIWLLYLLASRLLGRTAGLIAAAIEAVAFLPVFYSHLALNDVPTLAPLTLSLLGSAGVLRRGRALDYALAGLGLGLACATKYTAGIALLPLLAAAASRVPASGERGVGGGVGVVGVSGGVGVGGRVGVGGGVGVLGGLVLGGLVALAAFVLANPYAILDYHSFQRELVHQSTLAGEAQGKLGAPRSGGLAYYLWSLTWGLGWAPALAALGGTLLIFKREPALGWLLVPAPLLFLAFMGLQGRYFGRWLLPIFPLLCVLAAYLAIAAGEAAAARSPRLGVAVLALAAAALCAQGLIYSVHSSLVLARADTRTLTRAWMVAHVPAGASVVVEPVVPNAWLTDAGGGGGEPRWVKYPSLTRALDPASGAPLARPTRVRPEDYARTLGPALLAYYQSNGYCWVISGSTESGRAYADRRAVPHAVAYYGELGRVGRVAFRASPYRAGGSNSVPFGFDWSFDYYPLAYERPGPLMTVYRLTGGACA